MERIIGAYLMLLVLAIIIAYATTSITFQMMGFKMENEEYKNYLIFLIIIFFIGLKLVL